MYRSACRLVMQVRCIQVPLYDKIYCFVMLVCFVFVCKFASFDLDRLICIAPVLGAKLFPGCEVTVGSDVEEGDKWPNVGAAKAIQAMKAKHVKKDVTVSFF